MSDVLTTLLAPEHRFLWRAAALCVLLGVSSSMLGCVLVVRRLSLMGDALAHSLLPGVGIAWLLVGTSLPALLVGGLTAGLVTALASGLISRLTRVKEDAAFAALFIGLFGLGQVKQYQVFIHVSFLPEGSNIEVAGTMAVMAMVAWKASWAIGSCASVAAA